MRMTGVAEVQFPLQPLPAGTFTAQQRSHSIRLDLQLGVALGTDLPEAWGEQQGGDAGLLTPLK